MTLEEVQQLCAGHTRLCLSIDEGESVYLQMGEQVVQVKLVRSGSNGARLLVGADPNVNVAREKNIQRLRPPGRVAPSDSGAGDRKVPSAVSSIDLQA